VLIADDLLFCFALALLLCVVCSNGVERLVNGECQAASGDMTLACDDKDDCTIDSCLEEHGKCVYVLQNSTECHAHVCGGDKCQRVCTPGQKCGSDGCGGSCGQCQVGESCVMETGECASDASLAGSCLNPYEINMFASQAQQAAWQADPARFSKPAMQSDPAFASSASDALPSELSRHVLRIPGVDNSGADSINPTCISFGSQPDAIYRFMIPENKIVSGEQARTEAAQGALPLMANMDPLGQSVVRRDGYVALDVQAYGKFNPRLDTVVEVRGTPGVFPSPESQQLLQGAADPAALLLARLEQVGTEDPVYACLQDRSAINGSMITPSGATASQPQGEAYQFVLANSDLERARRFALGMPAEGPAVPVLPVGSDPATSAKPMASFTMCNDNNTPPGGLGSRLTVLLPPGTYYLAFSTFPTFNLPERVQAVHDAAAGPIAPGTSEAQLHEVEAVVRFLNAYLPDCANVECGSDGAGNECGRGCETNQRCSEATNKCVPDPCVPRCDGRTCGSDGCEGFCGHCSLGSLSAATIAATPNLLGRPFSNDDVYCVEERDPALVPLHQSGSVNATEADELGPASCQLMPRQCEGSRPICYGMPPLSVGGAPEPGCPADTFCANDCRCLSPDAALPDLLVKLDALVTQLSVADLAFSSRSCSLVEKCISRPGVRKLLRFSVAIINQGKSDLILPEPKAKPDEFVYSPCHHHYHYTRFAGQLHTQQCAMTQRAAASTSEEWTDTADSTGRKRHKRKEQGGWRMEGRKTMQGDTARER
jgi:hypothetical protein